MSANLGTVVAILAADNTRLQQGLAKAQEDLKNHGKKSEGLLGFFKDTGKKLGFGMALGIGVGIGEKLVSVTGEIFKKAFERLPEIAKIGELAKSFGVPIEKFSALQGAAAASGSDIRDFQEALATLGKAGFDAATGSGEAGKAFQDLKIDVDEFNKLDAVDKFYKLNEALKDVDATTKKAHLGKMVGEDSTKNLVTLMNKSNEEIKTMGDSYKITAGDAAEASMASEAFAEAQAAIQKGWDKIMIAIAPVLQVIAAQIPGAVDWMIDKFGDLKSFVMPIFKNLIKGIDGFWSSLKIGAGIIGMVVGKIISMFGSVLKTIGKVLDMAIDKLPESMKADWMKDLSKGIKNVGKDIDEFGKKSTASNEKMAVDSLASFGANFSKIDAFFDKFDKKRTEEKKKREEQLNVQDIPKPPESGVDVSKVEAGLRGSKEAATIQLNSNFQSNLKTDAQKQLDIAQQQLDVLKEIAANKGPSELPQFGII